MKIKCKINNKETTIELQAMDGMDFYDLLSAYKMGQMKFSQYAENVIKECVAKPVEARQVKFFSTCPNVLDKILFQCAKISNAGLSEEVEIEIIEE